MPEQRRARRHHLVSRFYLRGFSKEERLLCAPRDGADEFLTSINDATVQRDFYTLTAPDGTKSDAFESWMGEVESDATPVLEELVGGQPPPPVGDRRLDFAGWVALMHLRGAAQRRMVTQVGALFDAAKSAGPVGDLEARMRNAVLEASTSSARVDPEEHVRVIRDVMPKVAALLMISPWRVLHVPEGNLVVSDHPVDLVPAAHVTLREGVGLNNAAVMLPLARRTLLVISTYQSGSGLPDLLVEATAADVQYCNERTILNARNAVYRHPDDLLAEPMSNFPARRGVEVAFEVMSPRRARSPRGPHQ